MSTLPVAAILVGCIIAVSFILITLHKRQRLRRRKELLLWFSQAGSQYGLSFSGQEVLGNTVIGLDGTRGKLLILTRLQPGYRDLVLHLDEVKACSIEKRFSQVSSGSETPGPFLEQVLLRIHLSGGKSPVDVFVYDHLEHQVNDLREREHTARKWEAMLNKLVQPAKHPDGAPHTR